jgi:hypothetical protein
MPDQVVSFADKCTVKSGRKLCQPGGLLECQLLRLLLADIGRIASMCRAV